MTAALAQFANLKSGGTPLDAARLNEIIDAVNAGPASVKRFGAKGDGVTDDSAAFASAFAAGVPILVPPGNYMANNLVISQSDVKLLSFGGATITKNASGPLFTITGQRVEMLNLWLEGAGGLNPTWGVGIDVRNQDFKFKGGRIFHTSTYCVDFTVNNVTQGGLIADCDLLSSAAASATCIRLAPLDTVPADKVIRHCFVFNGQCLVDTNGCETVLIVGCDASTITFNANSKKVALIGNRFATLGADTTILGVNHAIVGNVFAGRVVIPANNCSSCVVGPNYCLSPSVNLSPASSNNLLIDTYGISSDRAILSGIATPAYSASITLDAAAAPWQTITVTNGTAFTINAPSNPPISSRTQELTAEILNSSGGAMGAITWDPAFVLVGGAFTNPANTKKRFIRFEWNGSKWIETARAGADY